MLEAFLNIVDVAAAELEVMAVDIALYWSIPVLEELTDVDARLAKVTNPIAAFLTTKLIDVGLEIGLISDVFLQ